MPTQLSSASLTKMESFIDEMSDDPPPIDKHFLIGAPSTTWRDFADAKLRRFPRYETEIKWLGYLGHGREGIVFKAIIGNGHPVAVKVV